MTKFVPADLISALAADAINIQMLWDHAHRQELLKFALNMPTDDSRSGLLASVAPMALRLGEYEIASEVRVTRERETGYGLRLSPLNLGYQARYGQSETRESSLRVVVEQIPSRDVSAK